MPSNKRQSLIVRRDRRGEHLLKVRHKSLGPRPGICVSLLRNANTNGGRLQRSIGPSHRRFRYSAAGPPNGVVNVRTAPPSIGLAATATPLPILNHSTEKLPGASLRLSVNSPRSPAWKTKYSLPRSAKQKLVWERASAGTIAARLILSTDNRSCSIR